MSNSKAFAVAKIWLEQYADKDFELFKELCLFAYNNFGGLNMNSDDAVEVALRFLERYDRKHFSTLRSLAYTPTIPSGG